MSASTTMDAPVNSIAIIGMSGRFPGAENVDDFWRNLVAGVESISFFSDEELAAAGVDVAALKKEPGHVAARGLVKDAEWFDASFFGISAREAEVIDPQQRLFLEAAWEVLETAGYDPAQAKGYIGVYAGMGTNTYFLHNLLTHPDLVREVGRMVMGDHLATRVAYKLNLRGPALSLYTTCSTSLVAICQACQALLGYQCDIALAGGVSVSFPQKRTYRPDGGMLSPDGHCRPFDAAAGGTNFSDGLGVLALKRLDEAMRDGDQIYAVIRGFGLNNDGSDKVGFAAPSVHGQAEVIALAQAHAGVDPASISYIEAHGTATPLGDPIEIEALTRAFRAGTPRKNFCALGSVKSNIGHADSAAGVAGLIKTALALQHRLIPPTLHFTKPNPKIDFANSPFFVNAQLADWKAGPTPRRAGVSGFGIGGTNAHVVLEEAPPHSPSGPSRDWQLLLLSARTASALDAATARLLSHLQATPDLNLADAAFTLQTGRRAFDHRRMLVCRDVPDAVHALEAADTKRLLTRQAKGRERPVVFMFPGQGAQHAGMAAETYRAEPVFKNEVDRCAAILAPLLELDLRDVLFPPAEKAASAEKLLRQTRITQPALFVIGYALAKLWMSWGIQPRALVGHSVGEYVAACLAGVFTLEEALTLVAGRGSLVQALPPGAMLAVRLPEAEVTAALPAGLSLAAVNSPNLCVVAGPGPAIEKYEAQLKTRDVPALRLQTSHAFHSAMMDPVVAPLIELLQKVRLRRPAIPFVSTATGRWITDAEATDPHYWARHLREPVRFADAVGEVLKTPENILLEVGPGQTLATLAGQHPAKTADTLVISSFSSSREPELAALLGALGRLWLAGAPVDWTGFYRDEKRRRVALPTYPFERKRFWIEPARAAVASPSASPAPIGATVDAESSVKQPPSAAPATPAAEGSRRDRILAALTAQFQELSGASLAEVGPSAGFMEMGLDSLFLGQALGAIERRFGVKITFRQMFEEFSNLNDLADYLDRQLPPGHALAAAPSSSASVPAPAVTPAAPAPASALDNLEAQLRALTQQLDSIRRGEAPPLAPAPAATVVPADQPARAAVKLPLTDQQRELWLAAQAGDDASRAFNQVFSIHLPGQLGAEAIGEILQQLVNRHDALRTTFAADGSTQRIAPSGKIDLLLTDLSGRNEEEQQREVSEILAREDQSPFDLLEGPLFRTRLLKLAGGRYALVIAAHHIIFDGWSVGIFLREFGQLYQARAGGAAANLEPAMQFRQYVAWQNAPEHRAAVAADEAYWLGKLTPVPVDLDLPTDRPRPPVKTYRVARRVVLIDSALYDALKPAAAAHGVTLFVFLLAALKAWMFRLTGAEDIVVGIAAAGQLAAAQEPGHRMLMGHCVNTLPLRSRGDGDLRFSDHLKAVQGLVLEAYEHQDVTLGTLVRKLELPTDPSRAPLVPVVFNLGRVARQLRLPGAQVSFPPKAFGFFDLNVDAHDSGREIHFICHYNADLFDDARFGPMLDHFPALLGSAVRNPGQKISALPLLTEGERDQILVAWNRTAVEFPRDRCAHELIADHAARTPEAIALVFGRERMTYRELDARANRLARYLQKQGVGPDSLVGLCLERSLEMVVAVLGILKAGGAYVPLDPTYPRDRLAFLVEDSGASLILSRRSLQSRVATESARVLCLDAEWDRIAQESADVLPRASTPENLAYVIYTSGSTGRPKGVLLEHRGLCNLIQAQIRELEIHPGDRVLQFSSISFDASVWEIFGALGAGATLCLAEFEKLLPGPALLGLLRDEAINVATLPPSALNAMAPAELPALRTIVSAGEACTLELAARWGRGRRFINAYGPTETTVCATLKLIDPSETRLTIGRPIANTEIYILDPQLQPVPSGMAGELHIGGAGLARGYHRRPELTAEKFIPHPFSSNPKARLYKTGDLARYLPDGNIEYLGRIDHQVKIRGFRVELGEIEEVLHQLPGVQGCVVIAREDTPGDRRLAAYVVSASPDVSAWRESLRARLPEYMVPAAFVPLPKLPLTPNGKVDRKALPKPDLESALDRGHYVAPGRETERVLAQIWSEVLGVRQVGLRDNFFELGGHSLLAVQMSLRIAAQLHVEVPLRLLLEHPTIEKLAAYLDASGRELPTSGGLDRADRTQPLVMSFAQQQMWLLQQMVPEPSTYNLPVAWRFSGPLDREKMRRTLQSIMARHEVLRTALVARDGRFLQQITSVAEARLPWQEIDLRTLPPGEKQSALEKVLLEEARRAFDLARVPLWQILWVELGTDDRVLMVNFHHAIGDEWSLQLFGHELEAIYARGGDAGDAGLPELTVQYADYSVWQRRELSGALLQELRDYWTAQLRDLPPTLDLPADRPAPPVPSGTGSRLDFEISGAAVNSFRALAAREQSTLFTVLLAALQVWLHRCTGQSDIVVGTPIANREKPEVESLLGYFLNTLPIRARLDGSLSFVEVVRQVRETVLAAFGHARLPFEQMVEMAIRQRSSGHLSLYQVMFVLLEDELAPLRLDEAEGRIVPLENGTSKNDLTLSIRAIDESFFCRLNFTSDLFSVARVESMAGHLSELFRSIAANPQAPIGRLNLLPEAERRQILVEWNGPKVDYPRNRCLHELIEDQVARTPDAVAVKFGEEQLTYRELDSRANRLARYLQKLGVGPDSLVGICVERSLEMVVGLLGVLKAGGAYVPLDPEYPKERVSFMLEDAQVAVLLTQANLAAALPPSGARIVRLDADWPAIAAESAAAVPSAATGENLAYMIYTSGSTGRPKGALNTHRGIVNRLLWMQDAYRLTPEDRVLQKTPFSFDVSVWEFFWPLLTGAPLVVARPGGHRDAAYLAELIAREKITTLHFVPSMLQVFLEQEGLEKSCSTLRRVICSGEALSLELQRRFFSVLSAELHNLYGPTEASVDVTFWACQCNSPLSTVPIGRPIANTEIYILDEQLQPVPAGIAGELHIGGVGLARGYHRRPELTAEKFIPHPFSEDPKARLYKTGDLARHLPDGNIEYLGRLDHQVKIRGFRVELGEIEEALNQLPGVQGCVVVAREDTPGDQRLVAYVVSPKPDPSAWRESLRARLPDYMLPAAFIVLKELPLTPNGKIDRKALPKPDIDAALDRTRYVAPVSATERILANIWSEVLGVKQVGLHDNFFELGGHSLLAVRVIAKINQALSIHLPMPVFFRNPTVAQLAVALDLENRVVSESPPRPVVTSFPALITYQAAGTRPPLFFLHGDWTGGGFYCGRLSQAMGEDQPFFAIPPYASEKPVVITIEEMARKHVAAIQEHTPHGPYLIGGYCIGAAVALEIARQLIARGEKVLHLLLVDPTLLNSPLLRRIWPVIDRLGDAMKWDLPAKIRCFDRYGVASARWLARSPAYKFRALANRLGLAARNGSPAAPDAGGLGDEREILDSLDHEVYMLAYRLYQLKPLSVPITIYSPAENPPALLKAINRIRDLFPTVTVERVPGDHRGCVSTHASALVAKMKKALG